MNPHRKNSCDFSLSTSTQGCQTAGAEDSAGAFAWVLAWWRIVAHSGDQQETEVSYSPMAIVTGLLFTPLLLKTRSCSPAETPNGT